MCSCRVWLVSVCTDRLQNYVRFHSFGSLWKASYKLCWPGSSVGIATGYGLHGPGIESRWGARFSVPVETCPGAHPASCTMGTGSYLGVKSDRDVTLTPHPLLVPWSWKGRAIPLFPLYAVWPVQSLSACTRVTFTSLPFFLQTVTCFHICESYYQPMWLNYCHITIL